MLRYKLRAVRYEVCVNAAYLRYKLRAVRYEVCVNAAYLFM